MGDENYWSSNNIKLNWSVIITLMLNYENTTLNLRHKVMR